MSRYFLGIQFRGSVDVVIIILSYIGIYLDLASINSDFTPIFKIIQVIRIIRVLRKIVFVKKLFTTLKYVLPQTINLAVLLLIVLFVFR